MYYLKQKSFSFFEKQNLKNKKIKHKTAIGQLLSQSIGLDLAFQNANLINKQL